MPSEFSPFHGNRELLSQRVYRNIINLPTLCTSSSSSSSSSSSTSWIHLLLTFYSSSTLLRLAFSFIVPVADVQSFVTQDTLCSRRTVVLPFNYPRWAIFTLPEYLKSLSLVLKIILCYAVVHNDAHSPIVPIFSNTTIIICLV